MTVNDGDEITIEIPVTDPPVETPIESAPVTTVVTTDSNDGVEPAVMAQLIEQQQVNADLLARINELETRQFQTLDTVAAVAATAEDAVVVADATAEIVAEEHRAETAADNDDEPRNRTHPYWGTIGGNRD